MPTAFVLSGGGNLGAVQVGMLLALADRGVVPDVLVGTSVGAVNAAFLAAGPSPPRVEALAGGWEGISRRDDTRPGGGPGGGVEGDPPPRRVPDLTARGGARPRRSHQLLRRPERSPR